MARLDSGRLRGDLAFPEPLQRGAEGHHHPDEGPNSKITGRYICSGNIDCYDNNETGRVIGVSTSGARMTVRVIMSDGTSCIFTGRNTDQTINGGYSCNGGGALDRARGAQ